MGRKPNATIAEFFERGRKLDDASNRYEHTCKLCHERFPKGRIDALTTHLLKRCPALDDHDRQRVLCEFSEKPNQHGTFNHLAVHMRKEQTGDLSFLPPEHHGPALTEETVARTVTANAPTLVNLPVKRKRGYGRAASEQQQYETIFKIEQRNQRQQVPRQSSPPVHDPIFDSIQQLAEATQRDATPAHMNSDHPVIDEQIFSDHLALAASAARMMAAADAPQDDEIHVADLDSALLNGQNLQVEGGAAVKTLDEVTSEDAGKKFVFQQVTPKTIDGFPSLYFNDFALNPDASKIRPRGKFSYDRRKEVQEVRRYGACIRCRMLKKPCSGETPCSTCANVDQARHWKYPCVRARLADEFDVLKDSLHFMIALNETNAIKGAGTFAKSSKPIHATHFPDAVVPAVFKSVRGQAAANALPDRVQAATTEEASGSMVEVEFIDYEYSTTTEMVESYLERASKLICEAEVSAFMRETLVMSIEILQQRADTLLDQALDFWISVHLLVDDDCVWHLTDDEKGQGDGIKDTKGVVSGAATSRRLIQAQLRGFVEKRAGQIGRILMNEFEKRLIQRQRLQKSQFETFLTAVIVMNCLEKLAWLYSTWIPASDHDSDQQQGVQSTKRGYWPLPQKPAEYVEKCERVVDMVAMLMKIREISPPMTVDEEGYVHPDLTRKHSTTSRFDSSGFTRPIVNDDGIEPQDQQATDLTLEKPAANSDDNIPAGAVGHASSSNRLGSMEEGQVPSGGLLEDSLMRHLQQAAAEVAGGMHDDTGFEQDDEDTNALLADLLPHQQPPVVGWFDKVRIKVDDLQRARFDAPWDPDNSRCWELKYVGRMLLPDNAVPLQHRS